MKFEGERRLRSRDRAAAIPPLFVMVAHVALAMSLSCGRGPGAVGSDARRPLGAGAQVAVGSVASDIARARGTSIDEARRAMVSDARVSMVATARGLAASGAPIWAAATALARAELKSVWWGAESDGEIRATERDKLRVIHAVVRRSAGASEARLREIAEALRSAVAAARSTADFEARCSRFAREYPGIRVERLAPFDATGATDEGGGAFDVDFVAAAWDLRTAGDTSEVAQTQFGWHVIRLLERIPSQATELPSTAFREAVVELRARQRLRAVLLRQRTRLVPEESSGAEAVMAEAVVGIL